MSKYIDMTNIKRFSVHVVSIKSVSSWKMPVFKKHPVQLNSCSSIDIYICIYTYIYIYISTYPTHAIFTSTWVHIVRTWPYTLISIDGEPITTNFVFLFIIQVSKRNNNNFLYWLLLFTMSYIHTYTHKYFYIYIFLYIYIYDIFIPLYRYIFEHMNMNVITLI